MKIRYLFLLLFGGSPLVVAKSNPSGIDYTENKQPFIRDSLGILSREEAPPTYIVQPGDTLSDICEQLVGKRDYWPKLWEMNPHIKNPNIIEPGTIVRFFPDKSDLIVKVESEEISEEKKTQIKEMTNEVPEEVAVAEATVENDRIFGSPVYANPKFQSFAQNMMRLNSDIFDSDISTVGAVYPIEEQTIEIPAFYFEQEPEQLAVFLKGEFGKNLAGNGDLIFVKGDGIQEQTRYTLVRPSDKDPFRYDYVAQVTAHSASGIYAQMRVSQARRVVKEGDIVVPYQSILRNINWNINKPTEFPSSPAKIIGFNESGQTFGYSGHIIYLDQSLSEGSFYWIYQKQTLERGTSFFTMIGSARIIDNFGTIAVGLIENNKTAVRLGDTFGSEATL